MEHGTRLVAVGVGPGDPELITLKGARAIREADVVVAPAAERNGPSIARSIAEGLIDPDRQEILTQIFPMRRGGEGVEEAWRASAQQVASLVRQGKTVAFLTLGDPYLYSTFQYLYRELRRLAPEIPVEVVPGVSSICAAAALADLPLGLGDERLAIVPAACDEERLRRLLADFEVLVLMKVHRDFFRLRDLLAAAGLKERAAYLRRVGLPEEARFLDLDEVTEDDLDYLSLIIVRREERENHG